MNFVMGGVGGVGGGGVDISPGSYMYHNTYTSPQTRGKRTVGGGPALVDTRHRLSHCWFLKPTLLKAVISRVIICGTD